MGVMNLGVVISDLDGVFCEDAPLAVIYDEWINDPKPNFLTKMPIHTIVTARKERFRKQTEEWLARYGVRYSQLVMEIDFDDRITMVNRMRPRPNIIFESDDSHARKLWKGTRVPTICFDSTKIYCRGTD